MRGAFETRRRRPGQGSPLETLQVPALQVSGPLQNIPSSQISVFGLNMHPIASQTSSVHGLPSSHVPGMQGPGGPASMPSGSNAASAQTE